MGRATGPVEHTRAGLALHLDDAELALLGRLLGDLRTLIGSEPSNPALRRLFPPAYHADEEAEAEYQRLMREELMVSRTAALEAVDRALAARLVPHDEVMGFMQSLNSLRLVLGTLLDVDEDMDDVADDDPHAPEHQLYAFLSWLLDRTVQAAS